MNSLHVHTAPVLYFKRDLSITLLSTQVHCMCTPHLYYTLSVIYPSHCHLLKFTAVTQSFDAQSILPHAVIKKLRCYEAKVEPSNAYFEGLLWTR